MTSPDAKQEAMQSVKDLAENYQKTLPEDDSERDEIGKLVTDIERYLTEREAQTYEQAGKAASPFNRCHQRCAAGRKL